MEPARVVVILVPRLSRLNVMLHSGDAAAPADDLSLPHSSHLEARSRTKQVDHFAPSRRLFAASFGLVILLRDGFAPLRQSRLSVAASPLRYEHDLACLSRDEAEAGRAGTSITR